MKRFIQNIKNIWTVKELRERILLTLFLVLVYRIGSFIMLPGVNSEAVLANASRKDASNALESLLSMFSGGGFTNVSFMALGIMPYISASIIMQLMGMAVPSIQKLQNEGESGRKRIDMYTRVLTILICAVQAPSYISLYASSIPGALPAQLTTMWWATAVACMVAGAMFAVWSGERITDKGIGNGISLLITVGILSRFPTSFMAEMVANKDFPLKIVLEIIVFMLIVLATILIVQGVRKIPLNTAKKIVGNRAVDEQGARNYLPLKVNASGVMPIIFAQAIMTIPVMLFSGKDSGAIQYALGNPHGLTYNALLALLIIVFTYFYTAIMINPRKMADDLKRSGGFIPGVRPGEETAEYIDVVMSRITFPGSLFLALIAIIPSIAYSMFGITTGFEQFFGGTSLLIMVAVVLDTLQQIESYLLNRHMDGLMEGSKVRGRRGVNEISSGI
jgi:preprotein translocase subunit SecY